MMVGGGWKASTADQQQRPPAYLYKLLLVGSCGTGKSSLIARFASDTFVDDYTATIGVDFAIKNLQSPNGDLVKLQIWDTAGQERFRTITNSYYRGAHGIMIVFDVTDSDSFEGVERWREEVERYTIDDAAIIIVGTKADMVDKRAVSEEDMRKFSIEMGLPILEASSKAGTGVNEAFQKLVEVVMERHQERRAAAVQKSTMKDADYIKNKFKKPDNENSTVVLSDEHSKCGKGNCSVL